MDQERQRIQDDLRGLLEGEVRCDELFAQMYASDASIYEILPLGVVRPRGVADVVACVQYAFENRIPVHARGAGTGLAGESLGPGLVIDFAHSMRRVVKIDGDTVTVQPGVVHALLNEELARHGRVFGPDPANGRVSTMGSVIALNAAGSRWLRYGSTRGKVKRLQVVLADGQVIEAGSHARYELPSLNDTSPRWSLVRRLANLLERESSLIDRHRPQVPVSRSGFQLHDVLEGDRLHLARLMVGSEGTLGLITEATLETDPLPAAEGIALLFFDRLESAAKGAQLISDMSVTACDLVDRRLLTIARESDPRYDLIIPRQAEAMLLVECEGDSREIGDRLRSVVDRVHARKRLAFDHRIGLEPDEIDLYRQLSRRVVSTLYRLKGHTRPLPFVEDIVVPPKVLPDFLVTLQNVLKAHQVTASLFAHAGHGQLHVRPFLDLANSEHVRTMQKLAESLYRQVLDVGGSISGEHGDGLSRTWFVARQFGPLYDVFGQVKHLFDPSNILNPGKVYAHLPQPLTRNLRPVTAAEVGLGEMVARPGDEDQIKSEAAVSLERVAESGASGSESQGKGRSNSTNGNAAGTDSKFGNLIELQLHWQDPDIAYAARSCNGCGRCRSDLPDERMCPIFRLSPREEASPRAKANLMRSILTGRMDPKVLASEELKSVADLCVNCHQCRLECPASVDIPKLMIECKAQFVATNGLRLTDWMLARLGLVSAWASQLHRVVNWMIQNRQMRWLIEKTMGIAQGRKLPRLAHRSFFRVAQRQKLTRPSRHSGAKVLYFVDVYATYYDVELAESLVAVLNHNGIPVYVPPDQMQSGMSMISAGALDAAKRLATHNVELLADAVRQGYHIVTTEPSSALCLTHEYPNLSDDEDTRLVAENTSDACHYLWRLHQSGRLELDLKPLNITAGYHQPCHVRALGAGSPGENLLNLIPGLSIQRIEKGCSAMAGTFGLKRENYRTSLRAGWRLISAMREPDFLVGTTECSACKMQMEQGSTLPTIHPLKLLALAYGLKPQYEQLLRARSQELVVT